MAYRWPKTELPTSVEEVARLVFQSDNLWVPLNPSIIVLLSGQANTLSPSTSLQRKLLMSSQRKRKRYGYNYTGRSGSMSLCSHVWDVPEEFVDQLIDQSVS